MAFEAQNLMLLEGQEHMTSLERAAAENSEALSQQRDQNSNLRNELDAAVSAGKEIRETAAKSLNEMQAQLATVSSETGDRINQAEGRQQVAEEALTVTNNAIHVLEQSTVAQLAKQAAEHEKTVEAATLGLNEELVAARLASSGVPLCQQVAL